MASTDTPPLRARLSGALLTAVSLALAAPAALAEQADTSLTLDKLFPATPFQGGARGTISGWRPSDGIPPDAAARRPAQAKRARDLARSGAPGAVAVTRLGPGNPDAAGLVSARRAGLAMDIWAGVSVEEAVPLLKPALRLPALHAVMQRILLAQLDPPAREAAPEGAWLTARADALMQSGEPATALALLAAAGTPDRTRAQRIFDSSLLTGQDDGFCAATVQQPGLAPDLPARIWCLAQMGDWAAAAVALEGGRDLGLIGPPLDDLLASYLDDSTADAPAPDPLADDVTPLAFRLHEAIGAPLPTQGLPLAYAFTDLGPNGGWLARIQSAERLARAGALAAADLAQIYDEHDPAASGAVWDRARSWQAIARALEAGDGAALAAALPEALTRFGQGDLTPVLAELLAARLPESPPPGNVAEAVVVLRLLAGLPVTAPAGVDPVLAWAARLAADPAGAGDPPPDPQDRLALLAAALQGAPEAGTGTAGTGPALMQALADTDAGIDGDSARAARGIAALVRLGHPVIARQAAIELIVLPRINRTGG